MCISSVIRRYLYVCQSSGGASFVIKKGGVKAYMLYDLEVTVPVYFHISTVSVHDSKTMK